MGTKRIGVLGSGQVGQVLAGGFIKYGYEAMIGTRNPAKLEEWQASAGEQASVGSFDETVRFGDIVIIAVPGRVAEELVESLGADSFAGKTVIDATNPISEAPAANGVLEYFTGQNESLMERLQQLAPEASFVKAFNSVGNAFMINPQFPDGKPTMFICGNDEGAKGKVGEILDQFGWEVEDMGAVEAARAIEPLCMLWCIPGFRSNSWTHAFKLLKL